MIKTRCWICGDKCDGELGVPGAEARASVRFYDDTVLPDSDGDRYGIYPSCRRCHAAQQSLKEPVDRHLLATRGKSIEVASKWLSENNASTANAIIVWRFCEAPEPLQNLSENGGDEDWLALVPPTMKDDWIGWLESPSFGCSAVDEFNLGDGSAVKIGSHA